MKVVTFGELMIRLQPYMVTWSPRRRWRSWPAATAPAASSGKPGRCVGICDDTF